MILIVAIKIFNDSSFLTLRSVLLYTTPRVYVDDITVRTGVVGDMGLIKYTIQVGGLSQGEIPICTVTLHDKEENLVTKEPNDTNLSGILKVPKAKLWWPRGMNSSPGYLYTLEVYTYIYIKETIFKVQVYENQTN